MDDKKAAKDIMKNQREVVRSIINKSLNIESKYTNRVAERGDAVAEIVAMIKNEVK
ncbi:hypothetical protein P8V03_15065 [Clostridium sp. A1-XYC3]|uniref:Uncharacterized protein n=1 Tax=Clostridium tanneri TaxID=3037988 RepID=A0ABU4JWD0_9CLOT|nr:hypothetical protein [Clostridium sp. A1-XYC3]MDW8802468.1 hypothetical protein [Clostridium sp. A1-XYC3]